MTIPTYNVDSAAMAVEFWSGYTHRCATAIPQMVNRYKLQGRSVLSIGGGAGIQEHHMLLNGVAAVTVVEPDLNGTLTAWFVTAPSGVLRYVVTDPATWTADQPYDTLFVSGYGADETRRDGLARGPGGAPWPETMDPFGATVIRYAAALPEGGRFIVQIGSGGVDPTYNPNFMLAVKRQLRAQCNIELKEGYRFQSLPGIQLIMGQKRMTLAPPLTTFYPLIAAAEPIVAMGF